MVPRLYMLQPSPGSRIPKYVTGAGEDGRALLEKGAPSEVPSHVYLDMPQGVEVLDRLLTSGNELIFSARAASLLAGCTLDPGMVRRPLTVRAHASPQSAGSGGGAAAAMYEWWHASSGHDILHRDAGTRTVNGHVLSVFEWIIDGGKIPPYDVFLAEAGRWFVSERFVQTVFENRLTGFGFALVPCLKEE